MPLYAKVGSFNKTTVAATASQVVNGVGFMPKAVFFWHSGGVTKNVFETATPHRHMLGMASSSSASEQFSESNFSASANANSARRVTQKAILLAGSAGTADSEASLTSFDDDGFTLSWTTNNTGESQLINYLALGGGLVSAKVQSFALPTVVGNVVKTGVGFAPTSLIVFGAGPVTLDAAQAGACTVGLGVATAAARASAGYAWNPTTTTLAKRYQRSVFCLVNPNPAGAASYEIDRVSLDSDGYTLNVTTTPGTANFIGVLSLKTPFVKSGVFNKPVAAAPTNTVLSGFGFNTVAALLFSFQDIAGVAVTANARLGIGAFTRTNQKSSALELPDAVAQATANRAIERAGRPIAKVNNNTATLDAEVDAIVGVTDGFTLEWNPNDAVATEVAYLAFGDDITRRSRHRRRITAKRTITRTARKQRGAFRRRTA